MSTKKTDEPRFIRELREDEHNPLHDPAYDHQDVPGWVSFVLWLGIAFGTAALAYSIWA